MRRARVILLVFCGALVLAGCTLVPTTNTPSTIAKPGFQLLSPTIPGTNKGKVTFVNQPVYFIDATGHLSPSSRIVATPVSLDAVLSELLLGPTSIERFAGYSSDLPKGFVLVGATLRNKLGIIDIATPLSSLSVLSAYDAGATAGVEITVAGSPRDSLLPNGTRQLVVTHADFASFLYP